MSGVRGRAGRPALTEQDHLRVADMISRGLTDQQIATQLQLSLDGAKSRIRRLYSAWGVRGRAELVAYAVRTGRVTGRQARQIAALAAELRRSGLDEAQQALLDELVFLTVGVQR